MNIQAVQSRLCRLIRDSLRPYVEELSARCFSPEIEKDLLISLSRVFRQIEQWKLEFDSDSDNTRTEPHNGEHPCEDRCMANIIAHLVYLINLQKPLIQHLTGKILVAISELSSASETSWDEYIHLLCLWLKFVLHKSLSSSSAHVLLEVKDLDFYSLISVLPVKLRLENLNYLTVASILCVLHNILKLLKVKMNDVLLEVVLDLINDTFTNVRWDLLSQVYVVPNSEALAGSAVQSKSVAIFCGNLVQLCCSLVGISGLAKARANTDLHPVIFQIRNLIPKIVAFCIGHPEERDDARTFHYLRHKILMLMTRLVLKVQLDHSDLNLWLHFIEKYFQDLLLVPLKNVDQSYQEDCLEGSPFWADDFDAERQRISSPHLQRLVVFLLLRCSLTLENLKQKAVEQFTSVKFSSCTAFDIHFQSECSSNCGSVSVLHKWLLKHLPADIMVDDKMYPQRCQGFAISFLKLYIYEDDLLFEMLLQLCCVPCFNMRTGWGENSSTAMNDMLCLISDLFNPIQLFHLFLAEIHYDHQVLLDYLISKDTGAKSAEYLLKCLRLVCNSWKLFVDFPTMKKYPNPSRQKRRKVSVEFEDGFSTTLLEHDSVSSTLETDCKNEYGYGNKNGVAERFSFEDAKGCLLFLKTSINNLNRKNLFPYNPNVLLRRLSRFEELCVNGFEEETAF